MELNLQSERELRAFGAKLGATLMGGEVFELVGDVGTGKTTLTKAIASGMGITDDVGSPSYTLSQAYDAPHGLRLAHYDFYRLDDAGVLANELKEVLADERNVTVIEWGNIVSGVLPADHVRIVFTPLGETQRQLTLSARGTRSQQVLGRLN